MPVRIKPSLRRRLSRLAERTRLSEKCCEEMKRQREMHSMTELVVKRSSAIAVVSGIDGLSLTKITQQAAPVLFRQIHSRWSPCLVC